MKRKGKSVEWIEAHASYSGKECLEWPFGKSDGYGTFGFNGHSYWAHRYICDLAHGPAPTPKHHAAHSCGNGHLGCVNPRHLSWKTASENQHDSHQHGNQHSTGKRPRLTDLQVAEIRALRDKKTPTELAAIYGIKRTYVSAILDGRARTWRALGAYLRGQRWQARIKINKKEICLGTFDTQEEARNAYKTAAEQARVLRQ